MELQELKKLVRIMLQAELSELEVDDTSRGLRVRLKRDSGRGEPAAVTQVVPWVGAAPVPVAPAATERAGASEPAAAPGPGAEPEVPADVQVLKSPMVGTFYRSPSPDAEPFVSAGTAVNEESVVCIIEAMKVMNEIRAEMKGVVHKVLVENGEPVQFGQPLLQIRKA
jgi:acetyl-CoA carboxylase biotin carboxyl carrier protein